MVFLLIGKDVISQEKKLIGSDEILIKKEFINEINYWNCIDLTYLSGKRSDKIGALL